MPWEKIAEGLWIAQPYLKQDIQDWYVIRQLDRRWHKRRIGPDREHALVVATQSEGLAVRSNEVPTVAAVLQSWKEMKEQGRTPRTMQSIDGWIRLWLVPYFGTTPVTDITDALLWQYIRHVIETKGKSPALVKNTLSVLRTACNALDRWEILRDWQRPPAPTWLNPSHRISRAIASAFEEYEPGERTAFSADELRIILEEAGRQEPPFGIIVRLAASTGMRRGEVLGLEWSWVDLGEGIVRLPRRATKAKKPRVVFLPPGCVALLRGLYASRTGKRVFPAHVNGDWVRWRWDVMMRACQERGVRRGVLHELRHSFCSMARMQGISDAVLQSHVGHGSAEMLGNYTHLGPGHAPDLSWADELEG